MRVKRGLPLDIQCALRKIIQAGTKDRSCMVCDGILLSGAVADRIRCKECKLSLNKSEWRKHLDYEEGGINETTGR